MCDRDPVIDTFTAVYVFPTAGLEVTWRCFAFKCAVYLGGSINRDGFSYLDCLKSHWREEPGTFRAGMKQCCASFPLAWNKNNLPCLPCLAVPPEDSGAVRHATRSPRGFLPHTIIPERPQRRLDANLDRVLRFWRYREARSTSRFRQTAAQVSATALVGFRSFYLQAAGSDWQASAIISIRPLGVFWKSEMECSRRIAFFAVCVRSMTFEFSGSDWCGRIWMWQRGGVGAHLCRDGGLMSWQVWK